MATHSPLPRLKVFRCRQCGNTQTEKSACIACSAPKVIGIHITVLSYCQLFGHLLIPMPDQSSRGESADPPREFECSRCHRRILANIQSSDS